MYIPGRKGKGEPSLLGLLHAGVYHLVVGAGRCIHQQPSCHTAEPKYAKTVIGVHISFDAANDALSIILNSSVPVSIGARCRRCSQRQVKMLLEPSDSWAEGVAVSI